MQYETKDALNWLRTNIGHFESAHVSHGDLQRIAGRAADLLRADHLDASAAIVEQVAELGDTNELRRVVAQLLGGA